MGNNSIEAGVSSSTTGYTGQQLMRSMQQITKPNLVFAADTITSTSADEFVRENPSSDNSTNITTPIETSEENNFAGDSEEIQQQSSGRATDITCGVVLGITAAEAYPIAKKAVSDSYPTLKRNCLKNIAKSKAATNAVRAAGPYMKVAGKSVLPAAVGIAAIEIADAYDKGGTKAAVKTAGKTTAAVAGAWAGAKVGAATGAAIGTAVCPGPGTAVGGVIGGAIGSIAGWFAGETIAEQVLE